MIDRMSRHQYSFNFIRRISLVSVFAAVTACSSTQPWTNSPLQRGEVVLYNAEQLLADPSRANDLLVIASFSGGGSRAAALAHATVAELNEVKFAWGGQETSLTREIDLVTGVSGGSIAAAHFVLHGYAEHLHRFPADFLQVDFQGRVSKSIVSPRNWFRLTSPRLGRGNVLAEEFDSLLFEGATFGDLLRFEGRATLIVGATDLSSGAEFDFSADQLGLLCSSIDRIPLSFAVAASNSVPLLFSPLTLQNFSETCEGPVAERRTNPGHSRSARVRMVSAERDSYAEADRRFVHLVDGGFSDNLGLRRITDHVAQAGGFRPMLASLADDAPVTKQPLRRIVFVAVNSERSTSQSINREANVPTMLEVLDTLVHGAMRRNSKETSLEFSDAVVRWRDELRTGDPGKPNNDIDIFVIDVSLADIVDAALSKRALAIPTAYRISEEDRALLRDVAKRALSQSPELRRFLASSGADFRR